MKKAIPFLFLSFILIFLYACEEEMDDTTPLTIEHETIIVIPANEDFDIENHVTITDDVDESIIINDSMIEWNSFDANTVGEYEITVTVSDSNGNTTSSILQVHVTDQTPPVITSTIDSYTMTSREELHDVKTWFTASDAIDGDVTDSITVDTSNVIEGTAGNYDIIVTAVDTANNETTLHFPITITQHVFTPITEENDMDDGVIYYITESDIPAYYDYYTALRSIQGIVNRHQPNLMIIDYNNPYYEHTDVTWKAYLEEEGYEFIRLESFLEVAYTFQAYFDGIIEMDDTIKSYNNWVSADSDFAAMMSSITYHMPVPRGLTSTIEQFTDLRLLSSFTVGDEEIDGILSNYFQKNDLDEAFDIYAHTFTTFKEFFSTESYLSLTSEAMDYAVSKQMMFFDLKPTYNAIDRDLSIRINEYFDAHNDYYSVYGWVDQEGSGLNFLGGYGGLIDVVGTGNLSLYHSVDIGDYTFEQKSEFVSTYSDTMKYVTFLGSEGDTIKAPATFQQGSWLDENRGSVPINWGVIADVTMEFPIIAKYMYESMTTNDYFFSGGSSSVGYVDIDTQMPDGAVDAIARDNKEILEYSDQQYVDTYNDLFTYGDAYDPSFTGDYLVDSNYKGAYGINPWESTGPIYLNEMLFYNRKHVFYPRRGYSSYVDSSTLTYLTDNHAIQQVSSDYWYIETDLVRTSNTQTTINFFTDESNNGYSLIIHDGNMILSKTSGTKTITLAQYSLSLIGNHHLILSVDRSSSMMNETTISVYVDKTRYIHVLDNSFQEGTFALNSDGGIDETFTNLMGQHLSQAEEIYQKILSDTNRFIVGYYGVIFATDYTESQYHTEPGPGEVISMNPTDFLEIQIKLNEEHPGEYTIVNMDEFYTYLAESLDYTIE